MRGLFYYVGTTQLPIGGIAVESHGLSMFGHVSHAVVRIFVSDKHFAPTQAGAQGVVTLFICAKKRRRIKAFRQINAQCASVAEVVRLLNHSLAC